MLTLLLASSLGLSPCTRLDVDAEVLLESRVVRGTAQCTVARDGVLEVAVYPRVLRQPRGLNDVRLTWFYPDGFEAADMSLEEDGRVLGGEEPWTVLGRRSAGDVVRLRFQTRVPVRNGTFGFRDGTLYLLGGWHPVFGAAGELSAGRIHYRVRVPRETVGFAGERPFGARSPRELTGAFDGRFLPLLVAPAAAVRVTEHGPIIVPQPRRHEAGAHDPPWALRDAMAHRDDAALDELEATLTVGASMGERYGLARPRLRIVIAPLRERLVEPFDGGIAVSDRAFHLLAFEVLRKFHRMSIWRAQLGAWVLPHARAIEAAPWEPELVADAVGSALRDRLVRETYGGLEYAPEVLETFAIIPEIDALIFAPQIPFIDAYYRAIDETPAARVRPDDFHHARPRGKLLHEKLVDLVSRRGVEAVAGAYLRGARPWVETAREVTGVEVRESLRQWLGPYPRVDYAIGSVARDGERLVVRIDASGPDAARVREPITVRVQDAEGVEHRGRRIGPGELEIAAAGAPRLVELDPDGRLAELHHARGVGPHLNNRDPDRWRFLLNNINGLIAVTNKQLAASVDFTLRRIHDQRYAFNFAGVYSPSAVGAVGAVSRAFGREVTALSLAQRVGLAVGYERLLRESGDDVPGDQVNASLFYGYDDRLSPYFSFEGKGVSAVATAATGKNERGDTFAYGQLGLGAFYIWPVASGHAVLGRLRGDVIRGDTPSQAGLRLGGRYRGGRGFETDEASAVERAIASLEYRHLLEGDARTDFWGLVTWTRVEGAFFGDAIYLPVDRLGCRQEMFYDAGYSLRFIGDLLNVYTASFGLDFGFPINRCPDESDRPPFTVYGSFIQSFSSF